MLESCARVDRERARAQISGVLGGRGDRPWLTLFMVALPEALHARREAILEILDSFLRVDDGRRS